MVTKVLVNRLLGRGKQVVGAGQKGCMCQTIRLQMLDRQVAGVDRQVAGAGQTGRPSGPG